MCPECETNRLLRSFVGDSRVCKFCEGFVAEQEERRRKARERYHTTYKFKAALDGRDPKAVAARLLRKIEVMEEIRKGGVRVVRNRKGLLK